MTRRIVQMRHTLQTLALIISIVNTSNSGIRDIHWTIGPNMPEFRKAGCATVFDGKVISVFGMRQPWGEMETMYIYDPKQDWWLRGPNAPIGQSYVQGTTCQGAFYAIGGRTRRVHAHCYRLEASMDETFVWTQMPDMNEAKAWAPSVAIDAKIYVLGGSAGTHGPTLNTVEMLDTSKSSPEWKIVSSIPGESRGWSAAAAVNGKIYLIGGKHFFWPKPKKGDDRKFFGDVLVYDPATREWDSKNPLPYLLGGMDCAVYKNRFIIVLGGAALISSYSAEMSNVYRRIEGHESYYSPFVLVYDTLSDNWTRLPSILPVPTHDIRVALLEDKVYALGGENIEPANSNTTPWLRIGQIVEN